MEFFGALPELSDDLITLNGFSVRIVTECTAIYGLILYGSFILSVPASLPARLKGMLSGAALLTTVNILRIAVVTFIGAHRPDMFEILHVYFGQVVIMLAVVGLAMAWLSQQAAAVDPFPFLLRAGLTATILFLPWLAVNRIYVALLDKLVVSFFAVLDPKYILITPKPFAICNHTFVVPLYLSLVFTSRAVQMRRKFVGALAGLLVIAGWNTLFRVTHVIWTAYGVDGIEPCHKLVYLLGQYLLPFLLWLLVAAGPPMLVKGVRKKAQRFMPLFLIVLCVSWPAGARGEALVAVQSNGNGGFTLRADGLKDVIGGDIRLDYMTYDQAAPNVRILGLGGQVDLRVATDSPGTIVFSFTSRKPITGSGMLATLTLAGQDEDAGRILSLSVLLRNDKGVEESARTSVTDIPYEKRKSPAPSAGKKKRTNDKPSDGPVDSGTAKSLPEIVPTDTMPSKKLSPAAPVIFRRLESVLDRFRGYVGELTHDAIDRLFAPIGKGEFRQEPAVLLTDGLAEAHLTFRPAEDGEEITCFIIMGGLSTAVQKGETAGEWMLSLVPERGSLNTSVTVKTTRSLVEYPLTVAPPLALFQSAAEDLSSVSEFVRIANERAH